MLAFSIATLGVYAAIGTFWSLPTSILTGTGAVAGLALVIGNCGGFVGPLVVGRLKGATGDFAAAFLVLAGWLALAGALTLYFGLVERGRLRNERGA